MYQMLLEIGKKLNGLDEKVDEINKWVIKKKKKINVIEWLNKNVHPTMLFENVIDKIVIVKEDIHHLFQHAFADTLNQIFSRTIYNISENNEYPIFAFVQKSNSFYIYENDEIQWSELHKNILIKFLNRVHIKIYRVYVEWKKENRNLIDEDEKLSLLCDKTTCKLMNVDFSQDDILGKIRSNMYSRMKTDMKTIIEYDFDF
jgi:hypothetical protein